MSLTDNKGRPHLPGAHQHVEAVGAEAVLQTEPLQTRPRWITSLRSMSCRRSGRSS